MTEYRYKRAILLSVALTVGVAGLAAAAAGPGGERGVAAVSTVQIVDMEALPELSATDTRSALPPLAPRSNVSDAEYKARKARAAQSPAQNTQDGSAGLTGDAPRASAERSGSNGEQTPSIVAGWVAQGEGAATPSDMAIAVSSQFVVQAVNSAIAVYSRAGVLHTGYPKALSKFFPGSSGDLGDVRAFYDAGAKRFVVLADDFTAGVIRIAVSPGGSPLKTWYQYTLAPWGAANCRASGSTCPDFPQLAFDDDTIYVGINLFPGGGGYSDWILLLPKAAMYAGSSFSYNFWSGLTWGGVPIDTLRLVTPASGAEHPRLGLAVGTFNLGFGGGQCRTGCNGLMVWGFSNNLVVSGSPGPEFSAVSVATANNYFLPASANEPGCAHCIDTGDVRISGTPIYHSGIISGSFNTNGSDSLSHSLWFQLRAFVNDNDGRCTGSFLNACPQVTGAQMLNEDCYFCGGEGASGASYYGTVAPTDGGDLTMVFNFSDNNNYPGTAFVSRRATQAQNTMHDSGTFLCDGGGLYTQGRWGDYTGAVSDFSNVDQSYVWFSGMYATSAGTWGTCIGENGFTAETQP